MNERRYKARRKGKERKGKEKSEVRVKVRDNVGREEEGGFFNFVVRG